MTGLVDGVISTYLREVEAIEREIDRLDEVALRRPGSHDAFLDRVVRSGGGSPSSAAAVAPNRDAIGPLLRPDFEAHGDVVAAVAGHPRPTRARLGAVENARELLVGSVDIYLGRSAQRSNDVMKTLTVVSSITLPAVVLAGVMGMNFQIPFFDNAQNFCVVVGAMSASRSRSARRPLSALDLRPATLRRSSPGA